MEEFSVSEIYNEFDINSPKSMNKKNKNLHYHQRFISRLKARIVLFIFLIILLSFFLIVEIHPSQPKIILPSITPNHKGNYRILAINYANRRYKKAQRWNTQTALEIGKVDGVINYSPENIDSKFYKKNENILKQYRGNGYWLWKPYFLNKTMKESLNYGDYLLYTDSGSVYLNSTEYFINLMKKKNLEIMAFSLEGQGKYLEKYYTKRDCFILMKCDEPKYTDTYQYIDIFVIYKKSNFTLKFIEEQLIYAQDSRIITDMVNTKGEKNYKGFIDHRHTQSIFSLLSKKNNISAYRDPCQWGGYKIISKEEAEKKDDFPIIFYLHERNIDSWEGVIHDKKIKNFLNRTLS